VISLTHAESSTKSTKMRTTLTIEGQLPDALKQCALVSGQPFRQVAEQALRAGRSALDRPRPLPYRLQPRALGQPRAAFDPLKARALADAPEGDAVAGKLVQRR
jgi:hypothetical protein